MFDFRSAINKPDVVAEIRAGACADLRFADHVFPVTFGKVHPKGRMKPDQIRGELQYRQGKPPRLEE